MSSESKPVSTQQYPARRTSQGGGGGGGRGRPQPEEKPQRVAIIGAGVAGCAMAGALKDSGLHHFTVFEAKSRPGGLWVGNYPGAKGAYENILLDG